MSRPPRPGRSLAGRLELITRIVAIGIVCLAVIVAGALIVVDRMDEAAEPGPGPHKALEDPCAPMEEVGAALGPVELDSALPEDEGTATGEGCTAQDRERGLRVEVKLEIEEPVGRKSGTDEAEETYEYWLASYQPGGEYYTDTSEIPGLGDRAFRSRFATESHAIWKVGVQVANVWIMVEATGEGKEAIAALAEQVARLYVDAFGP
jgi:hypothetical protein